MNIINRILEHTNKRNKVEIVNKLSLNGDCLSLVKITTIGGMATEEILLEFDINDLRKEYSTLISRKDEIETLFKDWGVEI